MPPRKVTTDESALTALPEANHLTLLFKFAKQTVLLSVMPDQPFGEIRSLLLLALQSRNITQISDISLTSNPNDLELAALIDRKDSSKGWVPIRIKVGEQEVRSGKKKAGSATTAISDSPIGAGLVDGSWIAVRVRDSSKSLNTEEEDGMEIDEDPGWHVIVANYDDEAD